MEVKISQPAVHLGTSTMTDASSLNNTNCDIYQGAIPQTAVLAPSQSAQMKSNEDPSPSESVKTCDEKCLSDVTVELENEALWAEFYRQGNEMIVTKHGRPMFPKLDFKIAGLLPRDSYKLAVSFNFVDNFRYRYSPFENAWLRVMPDNDKPNTSHRECHEHLDSPASGEFWTSRNVSFENLRLTNHQATNAENFVFLPTMRRYRIDIVVTKLCCARCQGSHTCHINIPLTEFFAVTGYQNQKITQLKIDYNPYASAFREGHKKSHIKSKQSDTPADRKRKRNDIARPPVVTCNSQIQYSTSNHDETLSDMSEPTSYIDLNSTSFTHPQEHGIVYPVMQHTDSTCESTEFLIGYPELSHPYSSPPSIAPSCTTPEMYFDIPTSGVQEINHQIPYTSAQEINPPIPYNSGQEVTTALPYTDSGYRYDNYGSYTGQCNCQTVSSNEPVWSSLQH